jgi:hypothetical protein
MEGDSPPSQHTDQALPQSLSHDAPVGQAQENSSEQESGAAGVAAAAAAGSQSSELQLGARPSATAGPSEELPQADPEEQDTKGSVYEEAVAKHPSREKLIGVTLKRANLEMEDEYAPSEAMSAENVEPIYAEDDFDEDQEESAEQGAAEAAGSAEDKGKSLVHVCFPDSLHPNS